MPLAEAQAKLIVAHFAGDYAFPPAGVMQAELEREREREANAPCYVRSPRHTMQGDFDRYLQALAREMRAGKRRAEVALGQQV